MHNLLVILDIPAYKIFIGSFIMDLLVDEDGVGGGLPGNKNMLHKALVNKIKYSNVLLIILGCRRNPDDAHASG